MDISVIAAWVGCITGIVSVITIIVNAYKNRIHLKLEFPYTMNIFFKKPPNHKTDTNLQGLFYIEISNPSNIPVTVRSIDVYLNNERLIVAPYDYEDGVLTLPRDTSIDMFYDTIDIKNNLIDFPLRLEPNDTKTGIVFLRFFPDINNDFTEIKVSLNVLKKRFDAHVILKHYINQHSLNTK